MGISCEKLDYGELYHGQEMAPENELHAEIQDPVIKKQEKKPDVLRDPVPGYELERTTKDVGPSNDGDNEPELTSEINTTDKVSIDPHIATTDFFTNLGGTLNRTMENTLNENLSKNPSYLRLNQAQNMLNAEDPSGIFNSGYFYKQNKKFKFNASGEYEYRNYKYGLENEDTNSKSSLIQNTEKLQFMGTYSNKNTSIMGYGSVANTHSKISIVSSTPAVSDNNDENVNINLTDNSRTYIGYGAFRQGIGQDILSGYGLHISDGSMNAKTTKAGVNYHWKNSVKVSVNSDWTKVNEGNTVNNTHMRIRFKPEIPEVIDETDINSSNPNGNIFKQQKVEWDKGFSSYVLTDTGYTTESGIGVKGWLTGKGNAYTKLSAIAEVTATPVEGESDKYNSMFGLGGYYSKKYNHDTYFGANFEAKSKIPLRKESPIYTASGNVKYKNKNLSATGDLKYIETGDITYFGTSARVYYSAVNNKKNKMNLDMFGGVGYAYNQENYATTNDFDVHFGALLNF